MQKTANQNIMPVTARRNKKNNLEIGGCDLTELAKEYGTPLYVYDEETIRTVARTYQDAFKDYEKINMKFAAKAFLNKAICKIMAQEGIGLDLCSGGEVYTAHSAGFDMSKAIFNGNNKTYEELKLAVSVGIGGVSVDNFTELAMLNEVASSQDKTIKILLRITPGIECHTHEYIQTGQIDSKFGFDLSQLDEAIDLIKDEYANLNLSGLHAHIGSQIFETQVYYDEVEIFFKEIARISAVHDVELSEINLGGGIGIKYTEEDEPVSIYEFAKVVKESVKVNSEKYNITTPTIYLEPGRSMVGTSGISLYTVGTSKQVPEGRRYVAVDGGMADNLRPSLYQAKYSVDKVNNPDEANTEKITIAGKFCESGDILAKDITLPKLTSGDLVCFYTTGAYGYSMSSNYNRVLKPAAVLVNNGKSDIIISRQSYEQMCESDVIPDRLK